jgi:hypothetical protein
LLGEASSLSYLSTAAVACALAQHGAAPRGDCMATRWDELVGVVCTPMTLAEEQWWQALRVNGRGAAATNFPVGADARSRAFGGQTPDMRGPNRGRVADWWGREGSRAHWQRWERGERELGQLYVAGWASTGNSAQEGEILFLFPQNFPNIQEGK